MNITILQTADTSWFIRFNQPTPRGEMLKIEISRSEADPRDPKELPYVAKKLGWSDKMLPNWWSIQTYVTDSEGFQWGELYNPTIKRESYEVVGEDHEPMTCYRNVIDFDWWLEATEENARKLYKEIERRAFAKEEA